MYESYYDLFQPYFGQEFIQLHYMHTDSFILSVNTKDKIKDLKNMEPIFEFSKLDQNQKLFSNKNKKVIGKFKNETPKNFWIEEYVCLRSKMYAFKGGGDSKNKLKGVSKSQSKHKIFKEYKNCLDGKKYQKECEIYILRSVYHEMFLQQIEKPTPSIFDDKCCYIKETESKLWN